MIFRFNRLGNGWWETTPVVSIEERPDYTAVFTENSEYHVKEGWDNEN